MRNGNFDKENQTTFAAKTSGRLIDAPTRAFKKLRPRRGNHQTPAEYINHYRLLINDFI